MNKSSVKYYQGMSFVELTLAEKTDITNFGRAAPDWVIYPSSSSGIQIYVRKFNPAVYAEHQWVSGFAETSALFSILIFFIWRNSPPVGQGLLIHEVSRSHTTTHHSR